MSPGHPRCCDLDLCQTAQRCCVGLCRVRIEVERRYVPCPADHSDCFVPVFLRHANRAPHMGFSTLFALRRNRAVARCGHCFSNRREGSGPVAAMLDDVFPPPFRIVVAGRCGECAERVGRRPVDNRAPSDVLAQRRGLVASRTGKGVGEWQVDGANFNASLVRPCDALPLGAERCKRGKDRLRRLSDDVAEQRNRRKKFRVANPRQRRLDIGRSLDEDNRRLDRSERSQHRPCRSWAMVADPQ